MTETGRGLSMCQEKQDRLVFLYGLQKGLESLMLDPQYTPPDFFFIRHYCAVESFGLFEGLQVYLFNLLIAEITSRGFYHSMYIGTLN